MRKQISEIINKGIKDKIFPGAVAGVIKDGRKEIFSFGRFTYDESSPFVKDDTIYDVASVTKSIPASCLLLSLVDKGIVKLEDSLVNYLPKFDNNPDKDKISIKHLLTYTVDLDVPAMSSLINMSPDEIVNTISKARLKSPAGTKFVYANSTALLIGLLLKELTGKMIDDLAEEYFFEPLKMDRSTFHPLQILRKEEIVPTEICDWRNMSIQGEVHDESSFILQKKYFFGVAGLFSTAPDILLFLEMLLNNGEKDGRRFFSEDMIKFMRINQLAEIGECAGLGWKLNQPAFMGQCSMDTCGITGFTGPFALWSALKGLGLTMLTNRIYPKRPLNNLAINKIRSALADIVFC